MESQPDQQPPEPTVLNYARTQPGGTPPRYAGAALLGGFLAVFLAPVFKCACGYLGWPALFVTLPASGLTIYACVRNQDRNLLWRAFLIVVVVVALLRLFKNLADVLWFGHEPLLRW